MGFLNDATSGYQKHKNTRHYTNYELFSLLSDIPLSFGKPVLDTIGKKEAIVYHMPQSRFDVYAIADKKNIEIARVIDKQHNVGKEVAKEMGVSLLIGTLTGNDGLTAQAKDEAVADRAVDELADVIKQLLETGHAQSNVATSRYPSVKLYMRQKVLSIKDKYSICDETERPVYWVKGSLIGLSFAMEYADGSDVFTIKKKLVSLMPEYTIIQGRNNEIAHLKKKLKLTRPEIVGKVNGQELEIKGDMTGYHFSIALGGMVVGNVDTERLTWGDCYSIEVLDPRMTDLVVAIAVICDNTLKNK